VFVTAYSLFNFSGVENDIGAKSQPGDVTSIGDGSDLRYYSKYLTAVIRQSHPAGAGRLTGIRLTLLVLKLLRELGYTSRVTS
jgi:hypothetical protein